MNKSESANKVLNGICPYFTMFPLDFPYAILSRHASAGQWVLDPFCGRGTTNYASRILGLPSVGIDSNKVAVALTQAKVANTSPSFIIRAAQCILEEVAVPRQIPAGEFWEWAYHREVLHTLCRLREGLIANCRSDARKALRAILMGALHGPRPKTRCSYLSNQCPRTYAPKPRYAVKFWKQHSLIPEPVDVLNLIAERANRYYTASLKTSVGKVIWGDSRSRSVYSCATANPCINWIITSPPYYGMNTYSADQWLRQWFVGGEDRVDYSNLNQIQHSSPDAFALQLKQVWQNVGTICAPAARLIVRFGGINYRKVDFLSILKHSFKDSSWKIETIVSAGSASRGKRQAEHFTQSQDPLEEYDVWARWKIS